MCIESTILRDMDFNDVISKFAKVKARNIDFL